MGLKDFASIFSRGFVIGYFVPAFAGLFVLRFVLHDASLPQRFLGASGATQILVIGGVALLAGLFLSGVNRPIVRLLEGYPLARPTAKAVVALRRGMVSRWEKIFDDLQQQLDSPGPEDVTPAALRLQRDFPAGRDLILPTAFGNAMRSFETHPRKRYGLDGVAIWPRIELLLADGEREAIGDSQANVNFFVNGLVVFALVGALVAVDVLWHVNDAAAATAQAAGAVLAGSIISFACYKGAIGAARDWGDAIRAAFDVHRLDLYSKLGVRAPKSPEDEVELAGAVNQCILFAEPIPQEFLRPTESDSSEAHCGSRAN